MYKIMQKYNKKLLAVVMVFLMIAFVIPQFSKQPTPSSMPAGTMGDETVSLQEVRNGRAYWELLKANPQGANLAIAIQEFDPQTGQPTLVSLASKFGAPAVNEIEKHPVMFVLLQKEAEKNGVAISDHDLDSVLDELQIHLPDGRNVQYQDPMIKDTETGDNVRTAVKAFMEINASFAQAVSVIKVSQPLLQNRMAKDLQEIKLNLVEFDNKEYADKVAPATPEQISEQFNKYGDELAGAGDPKTNPFGFGYKYPDRVKISYISIATSEVKKTIRAGKSDYDWDVEAQKYYKKHLADYPSTQPATSQPGDALSLGATSKPSTQPTTKPFAEVRDSIVDDLIRPEATRLESQIQSRITQAMREDWNTYRQAVGTTPATGPTSAPAPKSSVGVALTSMEYLTKLSEQVQKEFKVVPTVQILGDDFRDQKQLADLPGIGKSLALFGQQPVPFNVYAIQLAAPFIKVQSPDMPAPLQLFEPSRPMSDFTEDTTYIFRLTAADPAHKPADSRDVLQKVEEDLRAHAAYNLAQADAQKLLEASKTTSLRAAAINDKKSIITPSAIRAEGQLPTDLPVTTASRQMFIDAAFGLLSDAAMNKPTTKVIGLPRDSKVFVAQLADVHRIPIFAGSDLEPQVAAQIRSDLGRDMYQKWYRFDAITDRLHYVEAGKKKDSEG